TDSAMGPNAYPGDPRHGKLLQMRLYTATLLALTLAGCSDDHEPRTPDEMLFALRKLPGVHDVTAMPTQSAGYTYFVIHFEQKVDHQDPQSATFLQEVSLLH